MGIPVHLNFKPSAVRSRSGSIKFYRLSIDLMLLNMQLLLISTFVLGCLLDIIAAGSVWCHKVHGRCVDREAHCPGYYLPNRCMKHWLGYKRDCCIISNIGDDKCIGKLGICMSQHEHCEGELLSHSEGHCSWKYDRRCCLPTKDKYHPYYIKRLLKAAGITFGTGPMVNLLKATRKTIHNIIDFGKASGCPLHIKTKGTDNSVCLKLSPCVEDYIVRNSKRIEHQGANVRAYEDKFGQYYKDMYHQHWCIKFKN